MTDSQTYTLGPQDAKLMVTTGTAGPAAHMGHDLDLTVDSWTATLQLGNGGGKLALQADGGSVRLTGTSNPKGSSDGDAERIKRTIDERVLKLATIRFESTSVTGERDALTVAGNLSILGTSRPLKFKLAIDGDGVLSGKAEFLHTRWGIKQYSAMAGALKVADKVTVRISGTLPVGS